MQCDGLAHQRASDALPLLRERCLEEGRRRAAQAEDRRPPQVPQVQKSRGPEVLN